MSKDIDALAVVLRALSDRQDPKRSSLCEQLESLRAVVSQMGTSLALHDAQIAKLHEALALMRTEEE